MKKSGSINWRQIAFFACLLLVVGATSVMAEGEGKAPASFFDQAKKAGPMEIILLLTSIAGVALGLQAVFSLRAHLLRPPGLSAELLNLCQEGNIEGAVEAAQADNSFLGLVCFAALSNAQLGKEAMEGAMADAGDIESTKVMNKIGVLNLIAAIAPMLGLTGTTIGMIMTFATLASGTDITPATMSEGISVALICTFTGLIIAIPLLVTAYILKSNVQRVIAEIANDVNEMIRVISSGGVDQQPAA